MQAHHRQGSVAKRVRRALGLREPAGDAARAEHLEAVNQDDPTPEAFEVERFRRIQPERRLPGGSKLTDHLELPVADEGVTPEDDLEQDRLQPGLVHALHILAAGTRFLQEGLVDEATRKRIFDPFFTTKPTGTGLGLSVVHGIIRSHKGGVKIESEPGKGTSFAILLPAVLHPAEAREPDLPASDWSSMGTILVVDDEDFVREFAADVLQVLGFSVLMASNGVEAVELFRERSKDIDCVLLDFKMPLMDGKETFAELRRIQPDVRVILCSGLLEHESTKQLKSQGLAAFIQKPYKVEELRETLRKTLAN